jgi:Flp pilus assembly protein TadD
MAPAATRPGRVGANPRSSASASPLAAVKPAPFGRVALCICFVLVLLNAIVYAPVRHFEFVKWDDHQYVVENAHVSTGFTWPNIAWAFSTGYLYWHPVTWLSHMLDVQLYGLNAGSHHVTSVLLHTASTVLLFLLLYRMTGALGRSAFVAGLFAIHPLRVESVAWVAERKDVLSTLFWILTVWAYFWYVRHPRLSRYLLVALVFALALMSKPMVVTLPFVLLLLDFWPFGRAKFESALAPAVWIPLVKEKLPLLALAAASSLLTVANQRDAGALISLESIPFSLRAANAFVSYVAYVGNMFWPARLAAFYPFPPSIPFWQVAGSVLVLIAASVAVFRAGRRWPYLTVGWFWYLGTLLPVIGFFQAGLQARADRFTYVPQIGLFLILAWGLPDLLTHWRYRKIALPAAAGIALCACAVMARAQVQYWRNNLALWSRDVAVTDSNYLVRDNLGIALSDQGRVSEAVVQYAEAVRLNPSYADAQSNLGASLLDQGNVHEAVPHLFEALRLDPKYAEAHNNLANALASQGKLDEAITHYREALRLKPDYADAHNGWGAALDNIGNLDEAIAHYSEALRINPLRPEVHNNLGIALQKQGKLEEAARELNQALRIDPNFQQARTALEALKTQAKSAELGVR